MIWSQQMRKIFRLRRYWIIFIIALGVVMGVFGTQILGGIARTCPEPPTYRADVTEEIRTQVDFLFEQNLLYCGELSSEQAALEDPIYWGSDGLVGVLFFQPQDISAVEVESVAFGEGGHGPASFGGARPTGYVPLPHEGDVLANQAPAGASYYYNEHGAPGDGDFAVNVFIQGPAALNESITGRDAWRDLNWVLGKLRGEDQGEGGLRITNRLPLPILPDRWHDLRDRWVNPDLADENGRPVYAIVSKADLPEPVLYQAVSTPLASTLWVAGVVTGTRPVMALQPTDEAVAGSEPTGSQMLQPEASGVWASSDEDVGVLLAHFAFPPQEPGARFEARYWHDEPAAEAEPPDFLWTLEFPLETADEE